MRAQICETLGPPESLVLRDTQVPELKPHEVRIAVKACSINFPDLLTIAGKYQERPDLPFIPGGEVAGMIEEVGSAVSGLEPGVRVMAVTFLGGLAEYVNAPAAAVFEMPETMPWEVAAGFPGVYGTSYYALKQRAQLQAGETLLVLGASGGVGLAAVQIGAAMGARVIAAAGGEEKTRFLERQACSDVIDYSACDLRETVKALTDGRGADVIYDPVGGDMFDAATRCINWNGRILVVGFAGGRIPQLPVNLTLLKGMSVVGVFYGRFFKEEFTQALQNMNELADLFSEGKLNPHVHRVFELEDTAAAMNTLANREAMGKVIVRISE